MASSSRVLLAAVAFLAVLELGLVSANFKDQCNITWGKQNAEFLEEGNHLKLSLVNESSVAIADGADGASRPDEISPAAAPPFSFSIWPPTQRTRDAVVRRLVDTLAGDTLLCKRYGAVPSADADPAARAIEAEAFDATAVTGGAAASVEEGIEALQLYSKEVSRRLLDFVKARSAAAKAEPPKEEEPAAVKDEPSEYL